jgi:hypothetical protein
VKDVAVPKGTSQPFKDVTFVADYDDTARVHLVSLAQQVLDSKKSSAFLDTTGSNINWAFGKLFKELTATGQKKELSGKNQAMYSTLLKEAVKVFQAPFDVVKAFDNRTKLPEDVLASYKMNETVSVLEQMRDAGVELTPFQKQIIIISKYETPLPLPEEMVAELKKNNASGQQTSMKIGEYDNVPAYESAVEDVKRKFLNTAIKKSEYQNNAARKETYDKLTELKEEYFRRENLNKELGERGAEEMAVFIEYNKEEARKDFMKWYFENKKRFSEEDRKQVAIMLAIDPRANFGHTIGVKGEPIPEKAAGYAPIPVFKNFPKSAPKEEAFREPPVYTKSDEVEGGAHFVYLFHQIMEEVPEVNRFFNKNYEAYESPIEGDTLSTPEPPAPKPIAPVAKYKTVGKKPLTKSKSGSKVGGMNTTIVSSYGDYDVKGMCGPRGETMATVTPDAYGGKDTGWLGNPHKANDIVGGAGNVSREEATALFKKDFLKKIDADPAFKQAVLDLKGKKLGYYKPDEKSIHLQVVTEWLDKQSGSKVGGMKNITFEEHRESSYPGRTKVNASADATIALAVDFDSAGERLTKSTVLQQGKKYIPIDANKLKVTPERVRYIVAVLNSIKAKSLNIAGNGIFTMKGIHTQKQIDDFTYELLKAVVESPKLKTKIELIRTGGQTGFDESGAKAGSRLGIKTIVLSPKGYRHRDINSKEIYDEKTFKDRFKE